jgi:tetratricopeptide (TPR) repeat protein
MPEGLHAHAASGLMIITGRLACQKKVATASMLNLKALARKSLISVSFLAVAACATSPGTTRQAAPVDSVVADYLKGRFAVSQQQLDIAADSYESAAYAMPKNSSILRYAFFYELAAGDVKKAKPYAEKLIQPEYQEALTVDGSPLVRPSLSLPILTVAAEQMARGKYAEAQETLQQPMDTMFAQSLQYLIEAWTIYETDGLEAGLTALKTSRQDIFTGFTPLHRALMLDAAGKTEEAGIAYSQALSGYSNDIAVIAFAHFVERTGSREDGLALYESMAKEGGILGRAGRMGLARMRAPLNGETAASLRLAKRKKPVLVQNGADGAAIALHNFAWASYEQAMSERAAASRAGFNGGQVLLNTPLAFGQLAAYLKSDLDPSHYLIGAILREYELMDVAAEAYEKVDFNSPYHEFAKTDMAGMLEDNDQRDEAIELLQAYLEVDALSAEGDLRLADILSRANRYEEADAALNRAVEIASGNIDERLASSLLWRYYFARGAIRLEADRWEDAEKDLQKAIELSPDQPYVLNFLGYSWAERGQNLEEAFEMIEKALALRPNSGAITDSLGWAYYQLGEYDKAVEYLERAVQLEPSDSTITDHLGDAYWRTGRTIEARYEWQRVLTLDDADDELKQQVKDKLVNGLDGISASAADQ